MPEKVAVAWNVPATSSEQREQIDNMSNADTKGMTGGDHKKLRKEDEQREKDAKLNTKDLKEKNS